MTKLLKTAGFILLLACTQIASAKNIYTGWFSNKAVSGYDTVAFFTQGKPVKGNAKFAYMFKDVEWQFSSQEHLELFKMNPEKYIPQYGGYCAWAIAEKKQRYAGDPHHWKIVNNKLYLNYDNTVQEKWLKDIPGFIKQGDSNWPELIK